MIEFRELRMEESAFFLRFEPSPLRESRVALCLRSIGAPLNGSCRNIFEYSRSTSARMRARAHKVQKGRFFFSFLRLSSFIGRDVSTSGGEVIGKFFSLKE